LTISIKLLINKPHKECAIVKSIKFEYKNYKGEIKIREVKPIGLKFGVTPNITEPEWLLEGMDLDKNEYRCFVLNHISRIIDDKIQRFFCITVYVKDEQQRFLMLHNKKLDKWVPPGGKVDPNETPDEAALRECFEETGVQIELVGNTTPVDGGLMCPYGIQLNCIKPNIRDHIDLIYLARIKGASSDLKMSEREAYAIGWYTPEEIKKLNTFSSIMQWCDFFKNVM